MKTGRSLLLVGFLTAIFLSVTSAWVASSSPDGLERVAEDQGFLDRAAGPTYEALPDYTVPGIANERLSTAAAGVIGVTIVLAVTLGAGWLLRARPQPTEGASGPGTGS